MGKTSAMAKGKWNAANYTQIKVSVNPEVAAAFKAACEADHVSMASELSGFMAGRAATALKRPDEKGLQLANRGGRRKKLEILIRELEQIKDAEEAYQDAIPTNLQRSVRYENAEQCIGAIEEALDILKEAY
jgi:hypothetical protein